MKKFFIVAITIIVAAMFVVGIRYASMPLNTVSVERVTHEASIEAKGFVARQEKIYYSPTTGTVYYNAEEGSRVSKDALISTVYTGTVSEDGLKELRTIDSRINRLKSDTGSKKISDSETLNAENSIKSRMDSIYELAEDNDILSINSYKNDINNLRAGKGTSVEDEISELESKRNAIEMQVSSEKKEIYTEISGTFSTYIDGLEGVLNPDRIEEYKPSYINTLNAKTNREKESIYVGVGDPLGKVINDHVWYVIVTANKNKIEKYADDKSVKLRMKNMADAEVSASVDYISEPDESNQVIMMIKCTNYLENAFSCREADVEIIFESYTGYKVPIQAIRNSDNKQSVIGENGTKQYECECKVLYSDADEGIALVESVENAQNKLSKMERIVVGER